MGCDFGDFGSINPFARRIPTYPSRLREQSSAARICSSLSLSCCRMLCSMGTSPAPCERRVRVMIFPSCSNHASRSALLRALKPNLSMMRSNSLALIGPSPPLDLLLKNRPSLAKIWP